MPCKCPVLVHNYIKQAFNLGQQNTDDSKCWIWTSSLTEIMQSICVWISALLLKETFWRQQAGGLSVCGCQFTFTFAFTLTTPFRSSSHYHCTEAVQTRPSSNMAWRKVSAWEEIRVSRLSVFLLQPCRHPPTGEHLFSAALVPDVSQVNTCLLGEYHLM